MHMTDNEKLNVTVTVRYVLTAYQAAFVVAQLPHWRGRLPSSGSYPLQLDAYFLSPTAASQLNDEHATTTTAATPYFSSPFTAPVRDRVSFCHVPSAEEPRPQTRSPPPKGLSSLPTRRPSLPPPPSFLDAPATPNKFTAHHGEQPVWRSRPGKVPRQCHPRSQGEEAAP